MMRKRTFITAAMASLIACGAATAADNYPTRPVRIVVNSTAGGWLDVNARVVGQAMAEKLGQPVIIDNKPGADGRIGIQFVKNAAPDGYTLLVVAPTIVVTPALVNNPGYDVEKDFIAVGPMARAAFLLVAGPSSPDKNFQDLIRRARAEPDKLSYATSGAGTLGYLVSESILKRAGVKVMAVHYKGAAAALPDVIGGRVEFTAVAPGSAMNSVRGGKLKALAITSAQRMPGAPEIPTLSELGLPNFSIYQYHAMLAPAGVPEGVLRTVSDALQWALARESVKERLRADGAEPWVASSTEFGKFLREDAARYAALVEQIGLKKE